MLKLVQVQSKKGKTVNLLQLRNPWGKFEWKGKWSDTSDCWTEETKKQVSLNADSDPSEGDGLFWMSFKDFKRHFVSIHLCKFED